MFFLSNVSKGFPNTKNNHCESAIFAVSDWRYVDYVLELRHKRTHHSKVHYLQLLSGPLHWELQREIHSQTLNIHPVARRRAGHVSYLNPRVRTSRQVEPSPLSTFTVFTFKCLKMSEVSRIRFSPPTPLQLLLRFRRSVLLLCPTLSMPRRIECSIRARRPKRCISWFPVPLSTM